MSNVSLPYSIGDIGVTDLAEGTQYPQVRLLFIVCFS